MERRLLQLAVLLAGCVPVGAGAAGVARGAAALGAWPGASADSQDRYLSGLLLAIGLAFWGAIPSIERRALIFRTLTFVVFVGGLARLAGLFSAGDPGPIRWALVMELIIAPLLCLWQGRIAAAAG
jgi:hypothetical protein